VGEGLGYAQLPPHRGEAIAGALGAEIAGVDMSRELDDEVVDEVRHAFLEHLVIFLRDQKVTPQQQVAFAKRFGKPIEYPQLKGLPEAPMITAGGEA